MPHLIFLTRIYYIILTIAITCCSFFEFLRNINRVYGKLEETIFVKKWMISLSVPKNYYKYFYIVGFLWITCIIVEIILLKNNFIGIFSTFVHLIEVNDDDEIYKEYYGKQPVEECILALFMMEIQVIRRAYECFFIEKPSLNSKMFIMHHFVGVTYYLATGLAVTVEGLWNLGVFDKDQFDSFPSLFNFIKWNTLSAVLLFTYASYHQHVLHGHLASLRPSKPTSKSIYMIPKGDWFEYISSAHYFSEILIYLNFVILTKGMNLTIWLVIIWTVVGLGTMARENELWGKERFGDKWPKRWTMIPFVY